MFGLACNYFVGAIVLGANVIECPGSTTKYWLVLQGKIKGFDVN